MSRGVLKPTIAPQNSNSSCSVLTGCQNTDHFFHKLSYGLQLTSCLSLQTGSPKRSGENQNNPTQRHVMFYICLMHHPWQFNMLWIRIAVPLNALLFDENTTSR